MSTKTTTKKTLEQTQKALIGLATKVALISEAQMDSAGVVAPAPTTNQNLQKYFDFFIQKIIFINKIKFGKNLELPALELQAEKLDSAIIGTSKKIDSLESDWRIKQGRRLVVDDYDLDDFEEEVSHITSITKKKTKIEKAKAEADSLANYIEHWQYNFYLRFCASIDEVAGGRTDLPERELNQKRFWFKKSLEECFLTDFSTMSIGECLAFIDCEGGDVPRI
jgi:hypothetical protein